MLYIVAPAYNEEENIVSFINDWYPVVEAHNEDGESRLVVINDGSKDDTYKIAQAEADKKPLLTVIDKENGGHGATVLYGYRYAIEHGAKWIFQTDSDGQTDPKEFEKFWEKREEYDAILGWRNARKDGSSRVFVENVLRFILFITFKVKVPDANAPFRLMKKELVEKYIKKLPEDFNLPNVMLTVYYAYFKEKLAFEQISFAPRQGGKNSINFKRIIQIGKKAVSDFAKLKAEIND